MGHFELDFAVVSTFRQVFPVLECWLVSDKVSPSIGDCLGSCDQGDPLAGKMNEMGSSSFAFDCDFVFDRVGGGLFLCFSNHFVVGENPGRGSCWWCLSQFCRKLATSIWLILSFPGGGGLGHVSSF